MLRQEQWDLSNATFFFSLRRCFFWRQHLQDKSSERETEKKVFFNSCVLPRWILKATFCHPGRNFTKVLLLVWWGGGGKRQKSVKMYEEKSKVLNLRKKYWQIPSPRWGWLTREVTHRRKDREGNIKEQLRKMDFLFCPNTRSKSILPPEKKKGGILFFKKRSQSFGRESERCH